MEIALEDGERVDSLHVGGLKIIQNRNFFCFGMDAVLLSDFAFRRIDFKAENLKILDLCSGNAIVPVLLCGKIKNFDFGNQVFSNSNVHFSALEIQGEIADMARRSVLLNSFEDKISVKNGDLREIENLYASDSFDAVTCNPPYILPSKGRQSLNKAKMIARQEICCSLNDVLRAAFYVLKDGGSFFMVHRPERFEEIVSSLKSSGFKVKNFRLVKPFENDNAKMVLLYCVAEKKCGAESQKNLNLEENDGLQDDENDKNILKNEIVENLEIPPLVIYREKGVYTFETEQIYGRKANENL